MRTCNSFTYSGLNEYDDNTILQTLPVRRLIPLRKSFIPDTIEYAIFAANVRIFRSIILPINKYQSITSKTATKLLI
jgi:hypothetical protein